MLLLQFSNYEEYVKAQEAANTRKRRRPGFHQVEFDRIRDYWNTTKVLPPNSILCHGVRVGWEMDEMRKRFPCTNIIGTDLLPPEGSPAIKWDFQKENPEWVRKFDILYSNSWDHSDAPEACMRVWFNQLCPGGVAFIQWNHKDRTVRGGDCFGGSLDEYALIVAKVGELDTILFCNRTTFLIVARKKS